MLFFWRMTPFSVVGVCIHLQNSQKTAVGTETYGATTCGMLARKLLAK